MYFFLPVKLKKDNILNLFMPHFDKQTLGHLKKLCRIDCDTEEAADLLTSLGRVLAYVEQLGEVQTEGVKPCISVLRAMAKKELRNDEIRDLMPRDQFLANAPDQIAGMIRVPPVLKAP